MEWLLNNYFSCCSFKWKKGVFSLKPFTQKTLSGTGTISRDCSVELGGMQEDSVRSGMSTFDPT